MLGETIKWLCNLDYYYSEDNRLIYHLTYHAMFGFNGITEWYCNTCYL